MLATDIVVYPTLFGEWEITSAKNYFSNPMNLHEIARLPKSECATFDAVKEVLTNFLELTEGKNTIYQF